MIRSSVTNTDKEMKKEIYRPGYGGHSVCLCYPSSCFDATLPPPRNSFPELHRKPAPPPLLILEAPVIWPEVLHSSQKLALGKEPWGQEALSAGFPQPQVRGQGQRHRKYSPTGWVPSGLLPASLISLFSEAWIHNCFSGCWLVYN